MKLFGDHPELRVTAKLKGLITEALSQEAMIVASFIELLLTRAIAEPAPTIDDEELCRMLHTTLLAMLAYVATTPLSQQPPGFVPRFLVSVELVLYAASAHEAAVFSRVAMELDRQSDVAMDLLERIATKLLPTVGADALDFGAEGAGGEASVEDSAPDAHSAADTEAASEGEAAANATVGSSAIRGQGAAYETGVLLGLAYLFIETREKLPAFRRLVPHVFTTHLVLASPSRDQLNRHLAFDPQLEPMISESDDLITASFFWHGHVLPLFISESINASFPSMNARPLHRANGTSRPLYAEMLDMLLRLNVRAAGSDGTELAKRTREVLEQFERNGAEQAFLLTIYEKLDERTKLEVQPACPTYLTLPYLTPYPTLPYLTLPYLTLPYLTLPYLTLP